MLILLYIFLIQPVVPTITFHIREFFVSLLSLILVIWGLPKALRFVGIPIPEMKERNKERIYNGIYKIIWTILKKLWQLIKWIAIKIKLKNFFPWIFRISKNYFSSRGLKLWQSNLLATLITTIILLIII